MEGRRPLPGLPPELTGPLLLEERAHSFPGDRVPFKLGGRRRPWTRRPDVLLVFNEPDDPSPLPSPARGEGALPPKKKENGRGGASVVMEKNATGSIFCQ